METDLIFDYLKKFKNLPTYQFERRIDAFMLPYLEKAITAKFNIADDLIFVYPELPLKRLNHNNTKIDKRSEYADYLLWSKKLNTFYLVEFKTDVNSLKESQFKSYLENCKNGWKNLLEYYIDKAIGNKKNWKKFVTGLILFEKTSFHLLGGNESWQLEIYLENKKGKGVHAKLLEQRKKIKFINSPKMKFIYLAPEKSKSKIEKFESNESKGLYEGFISLFEFAAFTDEPLKSLLIKIEEKDTE